MEEVILDVEDSDAGKVIEKFGARKGEMIDMFSTNDGRTRMRWKMSSRALVGYRSTFTTDTRGTGVMNRIFVGYEPYLGPFNTLRKNGVLVSMDAGAATSYSLADLEARGTLFIKPQEQVYDGMIVGENSKATDLDLNPVKAKQLTNVRAAGKDENIKLTPPREFSLEEAMGYIVEDELLEVTPTAIRMRKVLLDKDARERANRSKKSAKK
jgi:GTP-binding protein